MCMENPTKITSDKVPRYGWKVLSKDLQEQYSTPFFELKVNFDEWIKADSKKWDESVHSGRITIFKYKKDADFVCGVLDHSILSSKYCVVKVATKQTTKYAYRGETTCSIDEKPYRRAMKTYAVDQIKAVEE